MPLLISNMTALDFWRQCYSPERAPDPKQCVQPVGEPLCTEEDAWTYLPPVITSKVLAPECGMLHLLAQERDKRLRSKTHICHAWLGPIPDGSFYGLSKNALVASPQFLFVLMAKRLSLVQLIALGYELCGLYSFDEAAEFGMRQRLVPLITRQALADYLALVHAEYEGTRSPRGLRQAERALPYIVECSGSPEETALAMMLSLPYRLGGYGLPAPDMNWEMPLSPQAAGMARKNKVRLDLHWWHAGQHFCMEYLGEGAHSGKGALHSDRARTNALEMMGFNVTEVTSQQLFNYARFELLALHMAKLLGKRIEAKYRGPLPARVDLRAQVFDWNRASGRIAPAAQDAEEQEDGASE